MNWEGKIDQGNPISRRGKRWNTDLGQFTRKAPSDSANSIDLEINENPQVTETGVTPSEVTGTWSLFGGKINRECKIPATNPVPRGE